MIFTYESVIDLFILPDAISFCIWLASFSTSVGLLNPFASLIDLDIIGLAKGLCLNYWCILGVGTPRSCKDYSDRS